MEDSYARMKSNPKNLKDYVECRINKTLPFNISWLPREIHKEVDNFCKDHFGNLRAPMIKYLWDFYKNDAKNNSFRQMVLEAFDGFDNRLKVIEESLGIVKKEEVKEEKKHWAGFSRPKKDCSSEVEDGNAKS